MYAKRLVIGLLALTAIAFLASSASAADTIRLGQPGAATAPTVNLKATPDDLAADTIEAGYRYGRGFVGYGRGFGGYGRGYGGYGRGYATTLPAYRYGYGYRNYGYGGWYGYRNGYGYRPYYWGAGYYRPYFWPRAYYAPSYYYYYPSYSGYYYYPSTYYYPIARVVTAPSVGLDYQSSSPGYALPSPVPEGTNPTPVPPPGGNGTYPYDGGPRAPVPMPPADDTSVQSLRLTKPALVEDLVVTMPGKATGKWNYPAYGETPTRSGSSR